MKRLLFLIFSAGLLVLAVAVGQIVVPWTAQSAGGPGVPTGAIVLISSGTCPAGFSEATELNGVMVRGTLAGNGDVGTSGGSDTITPTVNSLSAAAQTFTGDSTTVPAQTFTGDLTTVPAETVNSLTAAAQTISGSTANESAHTHSVTAAGTNAATTTTGNCANNAASGTSGGAAKCLATNPSIPIPAETFTGSPVTSGAGSAHQHGVGTLANAASAVTGTLNSTSLTPLGHNSANSLTPLGHNAASAVTGTLNSFDNRPAYLNVIFCKAN